MINIHAREITDNLASLVKQIDALQDDIKAKGKDTKHAFVVFLTDDPDGMTPKLETLAKKEGIKNTPLTVYKGVAGPKDYKIAKDADVTFMLWVSKTVKLNRAFRPGELDAAAVKQLVADVKKITK